ncbi:two-component system sensor histidine kinase QseC [Deinobacterium chartae]|uniref:histidine kinase n=1 Tax=Deinobacterium chartae TaxID=521158 RepID=A0A841HZK5_9DEIO|nr:HAMP domain-containing sensor histidine kinase [Deinobacterium chartae]MBB6098827.1 two-component system sensor histidine kinase QseC [Deinobacterium chartae]
MSLRLRLSLWTTLLLALALTALSVLAGSVLYSNRVADLDRELHDQFAAVARSARYDDRSLPHSVRALLAQGADVVDARVIFPDGTTWETAFRSMPAAQVSGLETRAGWRVLRGTVGGVTVQVGRPLRAVEETLEAYTRVSVPTVLVVSLIGGLLMSAVVGQQLAPLSALTRRVAQLEAPAPIPGTDRPDETGQLARALEASLERLSRTRATEREFVTRASHELRTPVAALRAELELALARPRDEAEYREALRAALRSAEHLERLSVNLLTLSRLRSAPPRLEDTDLWSVAADVVDRLMPLALQKGLSLELEGAPTRVQADPVLIARLLDNLIGNAIRYTPSGEVRVIARSGCLTVEDTGPGLPDEVLRATPEPFMRHGLEGSGVGLSVVRGIAEAHGTQLSMERLETGGSRVSVRFCDADLALAADRTA